MKLKPQKSSDIAIMIKWLSRLQFLNQLPLRVWSMMYMTWDSAAVIDWYYGKCDGGKCDFSTLGRNVSRYARGVPGEREAGMDDFLDIREAILA